MNRALPWIIAGGALLVGLVVWKGASRPLPAPRPAAPAPAPSSSPWRALDPTISGSTGERLLDIGLDIFF